jgi:hypothetical protein
LSQSSSSGRHALLFEVEKLVLKALGRQPGAGFFDGVAVGMPKRVMDEGFMAAIMPYAGGLLGDNDDPYEDNRTPNRKPWTIGWPTASGCTPKASTWGWIASKWWPSAWRLALTAR